MKSVAKALRKFFWIDSLKLWEAKYKRNRKRRKKFELKNEKHHDYESINN